MLFVVAVSMTPCVRVTIARVSGSAPREEGASMLVTPAGFYGTIGGGALEWLALARAQAMLGKAPQSVETTHALGPELGQCCGGRVTLRFEVCDASPELQAPPRRALFLFGAGHVGRALVLALAPLPFAVTWIDPRPGAFPSAVPSNTALIQSENPPGELQSAPAGSFVLVMTHSHALDLAIIDAALRRGRFPHVGLIGSATKRARFLSQLRAGGLADPDFVCPIGIAGIRSKQPSAIAAATAAQLLERDEVLKTAENPIGSGHATAKTVAGTGVP